MKVYLDKDEWYPVFSIVSDSDVQCDVSEETLARWKKADEDFSAAQKEMRKTFDEAVLNLRKRQGM